MEITNYRKFERTGSFIARNHLLAGSLLKLDGTGGDPDAWRMDATGFPPFTFVESRPAPARPTLDPIAPMVELIQSTFDLTVQELADACGLRTRKPVYDWKAGGVTPQKRHLQRLYRLREAALNWKADDFPNPGQARSLPLVGDQSLRDLLNSEPLDLEAVHFAGNRLQLEALNQTSRSIADPFV